MIGVHLVEAGVIGGEIVGLVRRYAAGEFPEGQLAVVIGVETLEHLQLVFDDFIGAHIAEASAIVGFEPVLGKILGRSFGIVDGDIDLLRRLHDRDDAEHDRRHGRTADEAPGDEVGRHRAGAAEQSGTRGEDDRPEAAGDGGVEHRNEHQGEGCRRR